MNYLSLFYLFIAVVFEVIGTTALKASESFTKLAPSVLVILSYGVAFYTLSLTLKVIPVGVAYAIWAGVGIVLISLSSYFVFKQKLDLPAIFGILLIIGGVLIINILSKTSAH